MKSAGTISISIALRSVAVASFGLVLMFMTSPLLSALTLGKRSSWTMSCSSTGVVNLTSFRFCLVHVYV